MLIYLLVFISTVFGWLIQGFIGIGSGIIVTAILILFMNVKTVIVSLTVTNIFGTGYLVLTNKEKHFDFKKISVILFFSIIGVFIGGYVLGVANTYFIKKIFGFLIILTGIYDLFVQIGKLKNFRLKNNFLTTSLIGLIGGFFSGLIGAAGTIYAMYFNQTIHNKKEYKFYISLVFFILLVIRAVYYLIDENTRYYYDHIFIIASIPAVFLGVFFGNLLTEKVHTSLFKKIVSISIIIMGIYILVSNA
jgi:uncharacterized membrane protein YfcA